MRTFDAIDSDPTVYGTMNGPTEFTVVGTIKRLRHHRPAARTSRCPVLLVSGEHDEVRPHLTAAMAERLRRGERVVFEDSSHMPRVGGPERFLAVVEGFLERTEA